MRDGPPHVRGNDMQDLLGRGGHATDAEVAVEHDDGQVAAAEEIVQVVIGLDELDIAAPEFLIHRGELFVGALQLLLGGLQFFIRALELLVGREDFLVGGPELLLAGLVLFDHGVQRLFRRLQFVGARTRRRRADPWRGPRRATPAPPLPRPA